MPEGDTIHKIAAFMAPRLEGETLTHLRFAQGLVQASRRDERVGTVSARGKHLFIALDNGETIRSHLGMHGSWHVYPLDADWQRPAAQVSLILETPELRFVCFNARDVEVMSTNGIRARLMSSRIGPDLMADAPTPGVLIRRAREFADADTLLLDTLLDQRVASGIGNVYKSEVLFLERLHVGTKTADIADSRIADCFRTASTLLRKNLGGGKRVTRFERDGAGRLWVYGRGGLPCHECMTPIRSRRLGRHHRGTWWCPDCQTGNVAD